MFKLIQCTENTYYFKCFSNAGVYYLGNNEVLLIDSCDHKKSVHDLNKALDERNWKVKAIVNTHSHIDHIAGNKFFTEKFGCDVYGSEIERQLTEDPNIEGLFDFNGVPVRRLPDGRIREKGVLTKPLTKDILPNGFDIIELPGHNFNMVGIKTSDDVWFLGDSLLMKETFESYKLPFFLNINQSIQTAEMLMNLKGKLFIPSHVPPCESIKELALYNATRLKELKEYILSICDGKSLEEIIEKADKDFDLELCCDKYAKVHIIVKSFLQSLLEDEKITADIERSRLVYRLK